MVWLIVIVLYSGTDVEAIEFKSMASCEVAADKARLSRTARVADAFCVYQ